MFSVASLSKSKFITVVALVGFVSTHAAHVLHSCCTRFTLVSLVSHSYYLCRTRVVRVAPVSDTRVVKID